MRSRAPRALAALLTLAILTGCGSPGESPTTPLSPEAGVSAPSSADLAMSTDRYDGSVQSVSVAAGTFQLDDGTTVQTDAGTRWKRGGNRVTSLEGMADAIGSGLEVTARGKGESTGGNTIVADDVDAMLKVRGGELDRFRGAVASSDGVTLVLSDGTEIAVNGATRWWDGPDRLDSMVEIVEALAAGLGVVAGGRGVERPDGTILATRLLVRVRESSTDRFRGMATSADPSAGEMVLDDSQLVSVIAGTSWKRGPRRIGSLATLETALSAGAAVGVRGKGVEQPDGSIVASELDVRVRARGMARFRGPAASVDEVEGTVTLDDGTVVHVFDGTQWPRKGRWLKSLAEIAAALAEGESVAVMGKGVAIDGTNVLAVRLRALLRRGDDS